MDDAEYRKTFRAAQNGAKQFFAATDGTIQHTAGTGTIEKCAAKEFVRSVKPLFANYRPVMGSTPLGSMSIDKGTFALFQFLESQTLNLYIDPKEAPTYSYALAQALADLGLHKEKSSDGEKFIVKCLTPIYE